MSAGIELRIGIVISVAILAVTLDVVTTSYGIHLGYTETRLYGGGFFEYLSVTTASALLLVISEKFTLDSRVHRMAQLFGTGIALMPVHAAISNIALIQSGLIIR